MKLEIRGAQKLSLREKQVVTYKEIGLSASAIAARLGIAASSVATLYNRARSKGYEAVIIIEGESLGLFAQEEDGFEEIIESEQN